eukprot:6181131-Pleurochrysis_carterae.AAC.1
MKDTLRVVGGATRRDVCMHATRRHLSFKSYCIMSMHVSCIKMTIQAGRDRKWAVSPFADVGLGL